MHHNKHAVCFKGFYFLFGHNSENISCLLCSPVFVPQMDGFFWVDPPGFVTEKRSVAHCEAPELSSPTVAPSAFWPATLPLIILTVLVVRVDGPVMTNESKSSLNWNRLPQVFLKEYLFWHCNHMKTKMYDSLKMWMQM